MIAHVQYPMTASVVVVALVFIIGVILGWLLRDSVKDGER